MKSEKSMELYFTLLASAPPLNDDVRKILERDVISQHDKTGGPRPDYVKLSAEVAAVWAIEYAEAVTKRLPK